MGRKHGIPSSPQFLRDFIRVGTTAYKDNSLSKKQSAEYIKKHVDSGLE